MEVVEKRKSIIHVQNVFILNPIKVFPKRETEQYVIAYEYKKFRVHNTVFKISKSLFSISQFDNIAQIKFNSAIDLNVREDYRLTIKKNDPKWSFRTKNITIRIIETRYGNLKPLYGLVFTFQWRHTNAGGRDELKFSIPECPLISNYNNIPEVCYKLVSVQRSSSGTHALQTYLVLTKFRGQYLIGEHMKVSNVNKGGHQHMYTYPVIITL